MGTITFGFSKASGWFEPFSWLIIWATGVPYSHAYSKFTVDEWQRDMIFQASHDLVNFMSLPTFMGQETVYQEFPVMVSNATLLKIQQQCADMAGLPYDLSGIFGLAYVLIMRKMGITVSNPFPTGNLSFFCSKMIALLAEELGQPIPTGIDNVTPADLYPYIVALAQRSSAAAPQS